MSVFVDKFIKSLDTDHLISKEEKAMAEEKIDRRVRKTRALLTQGLIRLMKEKDIKDISVKELSDLVDINRGTFYLHYSDVYDMVAKIEDNLFEQFSISCLGNVAFYKDVGFIYVQAIENLCCVSDD